MIWKRIDGVSADRGSGTYIFYSRNGQSLSVSHYRSDPRRAAVGFREGDKFKPRTHGYSGVRGLSGISPKSSELVSEVLELQARCDTGSAQGPLAQGHTPSTMPLMRSSPIALRTQAQIRMQMHMQSAV